MNCVVCGANVVKSRARRDEILGKGCNTCSPICTRAKKAGRTREQQFWADDQAQQEREANDALIDPISTP